MANHRRIVPPQVEILPGMPPSPFAEPTLDAPNALARSLQPQYVGIRPEDYSDITPDLVELASPDKFQASLIDIGRDQDGALGYYSHDARRTLFIGATAAEFGLLSGNIRMLGERAVKRTQRSRRTPEGLNSSGQAAAQRAGVHAVEDQLHRMQGYLDSELTPEIDLIDKFRETVRHPGYRRFDNEATMRMALTTVRTQAFGKLFEALAIQRGWTPQQEQLARRALDRRLFINRFDNQHISDFDAMLALAQVRDGHLRAITNARIWQSKQYIKSKNPKEQ